MLAVAYAYQQVVLLSICPLDDHGLNSIPIGARGKSLYSVTVAIPNAVNIIAPYAGGYLIAVMTLQPAMRVGYTLSFLIGLIVSYIRIRYLKETVTNKEGISRNPALVLFEGYKSVFASLRWVFSNMRGYAVVAILLSFIGSLVNPLLDNLCEANNPYRCLQSSGVILLIGGVTTTIASLIVGPLVDRIGTRKCMDHLLFPRHSGMALFPFFRHIFLI